MHTARIIFAAVSRAEARVNCVRVRALHVRIMRGAVHFARIKPLANEHKNHPCPLTGVFVNARHRVLCLCVPDFNRPDEMPGTVYLCLYYLRAA